MNNILVTGSNGQLGSEIRELSSSYTDYSFIFSTRQDLNITNFDDIDLFCTENKINTIINCAAYTAVDKAEEEQDLCNQVNHLAVDQLSKVAKKQNIQLIHISTDYVFNGKNHKAFVETDQTNPINVYGKTKWLGEQAMLKNNPRKSIIIRTSWVYSSFGNNFVKTMLKLAESRDALSIIADQIGTPTYAHDLAKTILEILPEIKNQDTDLFHYSNEGVCSWYDFAFEIFKLSKKNCSVTPIETIDYPTPAARPLFSLMNKSKIKNTFKVEIPHWKTSLNHCLKKI